MTKDSPLRAVIKVSDDTLMITPSAGIPHQLHVYIDSINYYFIAGVKILLANISIQKENGLVFFVVNEYENADVVISDGYGHMPSKCSMPASVSREEHNKPHIVFSAGIKRLGSVCPYLFNESVNCKISDSIERSVTVTIENLIRQRKIHGRSHLPCIQCKKRMFSAKQKALISLIANGPSSVHATDAVFSSRKKTSNYRYLIKNKLGIHSSSGLLNFCKWYAGYN